MDAILTLWPRVILTLFFSHTQRVPEKVRTIAQNRIAKARAKHYRDYQKKVEHHRQKGAKALAAWQAKVKPEFKLQQLYFCSNCGTFRVRGTTAHCYHHAIDCIARLGTAGLNPNVQFFPIWTAPDAVLGAFRNVSRTPWPEVSDPEVLV